ncbi:MAG: sigma-70 family RNA polymerase sigma factor [Phycisphaerae bacterium]|nr:sigma-70 family RNA polymerase sigma factor [Phycisphaerae bacterium]
MATTTSTVLLSQLKDARNDRAWSDFVQRYWRLLNAFGLKLGLGREDAADAAQEALVAFVEAYRQGRYERDRGRLRHWLFGIARNKVLHMLRSRAAQHVVSPEGGKSDLLFNVPDDQSISEVWELQWRQAVLRACLDQVKSEMSPETIRAFELMVSGEVSSGVAAAQLGMTVNAVMKAKRRVLVRMREVYRQMETDW